MGGYLQVMLVLFLELILLPTAHGCWVDFCLLPLFGSSWRDRLGWLQVSPISFSLLHWALGMATLMGTATLLSLLRKELRPGLNPILLFSLNWPVQSHMQDIHGLGAFDGQDLA